MVFGVVMRFVVLALCLGAFVAPVRAHSILFDRPVAVDPRDPARWVLTYAGGGNGLVLSTDDGRSGRLLCSDAMFSESAYHPAPDEVRWLPSGDLLVASSQGLWRNDGTGCGWQREPAFGSEWVRGLAPHPHEPNLLFAAAQTLDGGRDRLVRRNGDGSRDTLLELDEGGIISVEVVARGPDAVRIYLLTVASVASGTTDDTEGPTTRFAIRRSDDLGQSWESHDLGVRDTWLRLVAVDPTHPERVLIVERPGSEADRSEPERLRLSRDGGETFEPWLELTHLGAIAVADDGRIWVGDTGELYGDSVPRGLYVADTLASKPRLLDDGLEVRCLEHIAATDQLLLCQPYDAGIFDLATGVYEPRIEMNRLDDIVQCDDGDVCATCDRALRTGYCASVFFPDAPACRQCGLCLLEDDGECRPLPDADASALPRDGGSDAAAAGASRGDAAAEAGAEPSPGSRRASAGGDDGACAASPPGAGQARGATGLVSLLVVAMTVRRRRARRER